MDFLLEVLGSVLLFLLSLVGLALRKYVLSRIDNLKLRDTLTRVSDASLNAVQDVAQSYADDLRKASADGKLTMEERLMARGQALDRMKLLLGQVGLAEVSQVFGLDPDKLEHHLMSRIESTLKGLK